MSDLDLEQRLSDLADHLDVPGGNGLPHAVVTRLAAATEPARSDGGRTPWRRWRKWIAGLLIVGIGVGVAPAVADWIGIGGVEVRQEPAPAGPTVRVDPGRPVDLADAADLVGFAPVLPDLLESPDEVWVDDRGTTPLLWLHWDGGPTISQFDHSGDGGPQFEKHAPDVTIEEVQVGGRRAIWVGGPHIVVLPETDDGGSGAEQYESAGTLLIEIGSITIRIEGSDRDEAIRIARSFPGT